MSDTGEAVTDTVGSAPEDARITLSYLNAPESGDYIAVMDVLEASVNDLTPVQVAAALAAAGHHLAADVVEHRLESLREWRAISGTQDTSRILRHSDLLLRNRRYALTQAGRQVHRFYRTVLAVTVTIREIPLASMNRIARSLETIRANPELDSDELAEHIRQVFVSHDDLDAALVGAEDGLTGLADRFDLDPDSALELKTLLVDYATRIANELSAGSDIVAAKLRDLEPRFDELARRAVETSDARTLIERGALTASRGGDVNDWHGLQAWFDPYSGRAERFSTRLVRALPSMHSNLRRLHTSGGAATNRARALTLAKACRDTTHGPAIAVAVLGDHPWRKFHGAADDNDLVGAVSWATGPHVTVPPLLRLAGRSGSRGRPPAARDDTNARETVQARREQRAAEHELAVREVLNSQGGPLSERAAQVALATLMEAARKAPNGDRRTAIKDGLACTIVHVRPTCTCEPGACTGTHADARPALVGPRYTLWLPERQAIFHHPADRPTAAGIRDTELRPAVTIVHANADLDRTANGR